MKLTVVGCGDAFGSGGRFNTCFMIESGRRTILLDCGASTTVALRAHGLDSNMIDGVILTHLHGDHFGGLVFLLMEAQFLSRRERPLSIFGPPGTRERLRAALEVFFAGSSGNKWRFAWDVTEMAPAVPTEALGFTVLTAEVVHYSGAPSTGVRLSEGGVTLAYSGDTEWTDALLPLADGADLFIIECYDYDRKLPGHLCWTVIKERLPQLRAKRIMLTHMNPSMLAKRHEAAAEGLLLAEDGMKIDVVAKKC
jgi:ribonuclease BN (tRNA processing enzyme)